MCQAQCICKTATELLSWTKFVIFCFIQINKTNIVNLLKYKCSYVQNLSIGDEKNGVLWKNYSKPFTESH